jgi:hypothetical protein
MKTQGNQPRRDSIGGKVREADARGQRDKSRQVSDPTAALIRLGGYYEVEVVSYREIRRQSNSHMALTGMTQPPRRAIWQPSRTSRLKSLLSESLKKVILAKFAIGVLALPFTLYIYREVTRDALIIDAFTVPKDFEEAGLRDGETRGGARLSSESQWWVRLGSQAGRAGAGKWWIKKELGAKNKSGRVVNGFGGGLVS